MTNKEDVISPQNSRMLSRQTTGFKMLLSAAKKYTGWDIISHLEESMGVF